MVHCSCVHVEVNALKAPGAVCVTRKRCSMHEGGASNIRQSGPADVVDRNGHSRSGALDRSERWNVATTTTAARPGWIAVTPTSLDEGRYRHKRNRVRTKFPPGCF